MEANDFIAEVYRRMSLQTITQTGSIIIEPDDFINNESATKFIHQYSSLLPDNKDAKILDIGFGDGWFMSICARLGYTNIYGADFHARKKMDKILNSVDSIYKSLKQEGILLLRTPNMEGPMALSDLYITLGHEYGYTGSNIYSLLSISGFEDIEFHEFSIYKPTIKQRIGNIARNIFIVFAKFKYRIFGATGDNYKNQFGTELIVSSKRGNSEELFNERYR